MDYHAEMDRAMARFDQFADRADQRQLGKWTQSRSKTGTARLARKLTHGGIAIAAILAVMIVVGLVIDGIGLTGLFIAAALMLAAILFIGFRPEPAVKPVPAFSEDMTNKAVVQRLGTFLSRHRGQVPAAAGQRISAIQAQLPMLEAQLADMSLLDPLAQDARRLAGQHLPELIERYERVPPQYRREREGDGLSVDDRLVAGLDAAKVAIDDLGRRMSKQEMDEFETQGRFLESRYQDPDLRSGG